MFTAFLPEDFLIISKGQLKTMLRRFRSPARAPVAALGPRADPPNAAEQPREGRRCGTGPPAGEGAAHAKAAWVRRPRSCVGAPARGGRGWGSPRPYESRLLRQALTRRVRQRGSSAPVAID